MCVTVTVSCMNSFPPLIPPLPLPASPSPCCFSSPLYLFSSSSLFSIIPTAGWLTQNPQKIHAVTSTSAALAATEETSTYARTPRMSGSTTTMCASAARRDGCMKLNSMYPFLPSNLSLLSVMYQVPLHTLFAFVEFGFWVTVLGTMSESEVSPDVIFTFELSLV